MSSPDPGIWQQLSNRLGVTFNGAFSIDPDEHRATVQTVARWIVLGGAAGALAGLASAIFLMTLQWATVLRLADPRLLFLLPVAGFLVGWAYYRFGSAVARGSNLIIDELHEHSAPIQLRMAPMVLIGTVLTHLFGGSAGREGTAIQMGASLADWLRRRLGLNPEERRLLLMAGISGGFGSVFGTPVAGFIFGLEVQSVGRIRYEGIVPCLTAAVVGDWVARNLIQAVGITHSHYPQIAPLELDPGLLLKIVLAGIVFGVTSLLFVELTHAIKHVAGNAVRWSPLRPLIGGLLIIALTLLVGSQDYLGLSLPLIQSSVSGGNVVPFAFLLKLIFTAVTLGMGFMGGEVTPLFVIGATLGSTLGRLLGIDSGLMASIGFVAVFAGASNTPLACMVMGVELFGGGAILYLGVCCFVAYLASGHRSIYPAQRVNVPKARGVDILADESLEALIKRRLIRQPPK